MNAPAAGAPHDGPAARAVARAYLPARRGGSRWHYHYALAKLRTDPLYPGVVAALHGTDAPLLDLGCGIGLLAHALRAGGIAVPYLGVDNDGPKVIRARAAAERAGLRGVDFRAVDLACGPPAHRGSVAILDVLQFVAPGVQDALLDAAVAMLVPGARLVIRTGLDDGSRRARLTRRVDAFSRLLGWMNAGPRRYPDGDALRTRLEAAGLRVSFDPLHGGTPFNNWRVVAEAPQAGAASSAGPDASAVSTGSTAR